MMENSKETVDRLTAQFAAATAGSGGAGEWLKSLRGRAIARFAATGFPAARSEEWKYTNVAPIVRMPLRLPERGGARAAAPDALFAGEQWRLLKCVNGFVRDEAPAAPLPPSEARVKSLAAAFYEDREIVQRHIASTTEDGEEERSRGDGSDAFTSLNTAFFADGAFISIPDNTIVERPIHLAFVSESPDGGTLVHPRNLIVLGKNSRATVVETYQSNAAGSYVMNVVTEIVLGEGAALEHCKIERESGNAFHVSRTNVAQAAGSSYGCTSVMTGARLTRNDHRIALLGERAECRLDGLYLARGAQHMDNHTAVDHRAPRCTSREYYKGIMADTSRAVFNGKVFVRQDAQLTDARQTNKNLLLSDNAWVDTKPQLEIFADDVKCAHGATVGQLDENAVFYLRSRGVGVQAARQMLTRGFAAEMLGTIALSPVREYAEDTLLNGFLAGAEQ